MRRNALSFAALATALFGSTAMGQVIITEIHYNPAGGETAASEWIEIFNTTNAAIDLTGWSWGDAQDATYYPAFPAGTTLGAGQAAALIFQSSAADAINATDIFRSIWGASVNVIPSIAATANVSLANAATPTNERVVIRNPDLVEIDSVNYENALNGWADDTGFSSIYLLPTALSATANDIGSNWANSVAGVDGANNALIINPLITPAPVPSATNNNALDIASPGFVAAAVVPPFIKGDFNFDGEILDSDIQLFVGALTGDFASLVALFPERTEADFAFIGDFNSDGEVLDSDITGFVAALLGGGGRVTAIPEPAALGLLAPAGLLLARRRR